MLWPLFFALGGTAICGLLFGLTAYLGWRLAARVLSRPRATTAPSIHSVPSAWATGSATSAARPAGRPDWMVGTVELPRYSDAPSWRRDRALS